MMGGGGDLKSWGVSGILREMYVTDLFNPVCEMLIGSVEFD